MLVSMKHRGPDGAGLAVGSEVRRARRLEELDTDGLEGAVGLGHVRLAIVGGFDGMQPFRSSDGRLVMLHNGEIYNHHELREKLPGNFETSTDSEVILRLLEQEYKGDLVAAFKRVLQQLDGVYAIAVSDGGTLVIARDPIGVRQLYLVKGRGYCAFASERRALRAVAAEAQSVRLKPGHLARIDSQEWQQESFRDLELRKIPHDIKQPEHALSSYRAALERAVFKRVRDRDRAGVIFSGGIDSVLIAYLLQKQGLPFTCYTAGVEGSGDLDAASAIAERLGFPFESKRLDADAIEELLPEIMAVVEDRSLNQVEVAVPVFASVRLASAAGERVLFTGQGADEVFGGYSWYPRIVEKEGYDSFIEYSIGDIEHLYKETLEREDKITMAHSIELRVPYLDPEVVQNGLRMDPRLKIHDGRDRLGKRIHRELAESVGVPREFALRGKEAAQHGAGIHEVIRALARRRGFTLDFVGECGYDAKKSVTEVLGSSSRYGHRYGEKNLWEVEDEVQFYLDWIASKAGLLTEAERSRVAEALERADTIRSRTTVVSGSES